MKIDVPDRSKDDGTQKTDALPASARPNRRMTTAGRVEKLVNDLDIALRNDNVDPKLLESLGWNLDNARQFVEDYKREVGHGQKQTDRSQLPVRHESLDVKRATTPAARLATSRPDADARVLGTMHSPGPDRTNELRDIGRQRVPRPLDSVLRGYYSSLASQPAK